MSILCASRATAAIAVASLTVAAFASSNAHAVIVFDTISGASFSTGGYRVGEYPAAAGETAPHDYRVATRFTLSGDALWQLNAIGVRIAADGDFGGAARARVWLAEAVDGGGPLTTYELGTVSTNATTPVTVAIEGLASMNITMRGGSSYWLVLGSVPGDPDDTRFRWLRSSLGTLGTTYSDDLLTPEGYALAEGRTPGMKVGATMIPAPGALALLAMAGAVRRRRR
jgi:MYXO-CTERM domain-containing protein